MPVLDFDFLKLLEGVEITTLLRVSLWLEENDKYLMPCQFVEVREEDGFYVVKLEALDPRGFLSEGLIEQKFLFGHPGKVIGYGVLKEISKVKG